ncbi:hypothetical protein PsAD2_02995 [Pseudovibrio axinellae]|uniref:HNH nuclease domain-containing protein n=1 Tax=Pseudovibrio axinellae TaxID=989403 RepID=A0A165XFJ0_9HYPH|nr:HNH endonuclease [Pseudovibrio axinellae]KZL17659.1 hypothetical protein PsAD2_02995 [Pseudovibrio axinellae]SER44656.1 HNH endonuclease [Pseudovibrio axinellae]
MSLYILKPIFWNSKDYKEPSGHKAGSGFPFEEGYGHEEWNNSDLMRFSLDNIPQRAFHTEGIEAATSLENLGNTVVFMYACHDGRQDLVGVAGSATHRLEERERRKITGNFDFRAMRQQAWAEPLVREKYKNNETEFNKSFKKGETWIPNWHCPEDHFLWLSEPVTLSAPNITGKSRLIPRFTSHTVIPEEVAKSILHQIPFDQRKPAWKKIDELVGGLTSSLEQDVYAIANDKLISNTDRQQLQLARVGQGNFRSKLDGYWQNGCAVTDCQRREVLRASHIKPWRSSTNEERLDVENGLLLTANFDALFDRGLISFSDTGEMLISASLTESERNLLQLGSALRKRPSSAQRKFLAFHRQEIFCKTNGEY